MIVEERMTAYLDSLDTGNSEFLETLEQQAKSDGVPIVRRQMQSFLKVLLRMKRPARILEVGTAIGFSAILMCENTPPETTVTTIEKYEKRIPQAKENFARAGLNCLLYTSPSPRDA